MSTPNTPTPLTPPDPHSELPPELCAMLTDALTPLAPPIALSSRLAQRIQRSAAQSRHHHTLRQRDWQWQPLTRGIDYVAIHHAPAQRSVLLRFAPGSRLPSHRHQQHEECLVLQGWLQAGQDRVGEHGWHLAPQHSRHTPICAPEGALIYLRGTSAGDRPSMLHELLHAWLPGKSSKPPQTRNWQAPGGQDWHSPQTGIQLRHLWHNAGQHSRLLQLAPGARLQLPSAQQHSCLILTGESFINDQLLCQHDYSRSSPEAASTEISSDTGALVFLHSE